MTRTFTSGDTRIGAAGSHPRYDYDHQCWIVNGRVQDCGHPQTGATYTDATRVDGACVLRVWTGCSCYGRQHAGEQAGGGGR